MKQIYKRNPIQHSLPANYGNLDAVAYHNLNAFKGLQVYDNPLIADPASAYTCKNTYVDEHGNLTVRPALTPVLENDDNVDWKHVFDDGTTLILRDGLITVQSMPVIVPLRVDTSNIVPVDTGTEKYLFIQDIENAKNALYQITAETFKVVEGKVLLDDVLDTDVSHYNVLNDKVRYEYTGQSSGADLNDTNTIEVPTIVYMSYLTLDTTKPYRLKTHNDGVILVAHNRIYVYRDKHVGVLNIDSGYQRNQNDWFIVCDDDEIRITIACLNVDPYPIVWPSSNSLGSMYGDGRIEYYRLNWVGRIQEHITMPVPAGYSPFAGNGYGIALGSIGNNADGNPIIHAYTRAIDSIDAPIDQWTECGNTVETGNTDYSIVMVNAGSAPFTGYNGCVIPAAREFSILQYSNRYGYWSIESKAYTYDGKPTLDDLPRSASPTFTADSNVFKISLFELNVIYDTFNDVGLPDANIDIWKYVRESCYNDSTKVNRYFDSIVDPAIVTDGLPVTVSGVALTGFEPRYYTNVKGAKVLTGNEVYAVGPDENSWQKYNIGDAVDVIETYRYTDALNPFETLQFVSETVVLTNNRLIIREPGLLSVIATRPIDVIPTLDSIDERVITGFFLDNCWWFITQHHIFGTGADGDGVQTPERFDPLKYFEVSESITGAIRVSDTSFWVFHNNGAYLIYKTALTLTEGTEYRWLCTATAKSKGCDFENALHTLPVSSNVTTVTSRDICAVLMRENIQSDERTLVPITQQFSVLMRSLLEQTESVKVFDYKYVTVFCLNPVTKNGIVPAIAVDNTTDSWWYWEFPVNEVLSIRETEEYDILYCALKNGIKAAYRLTDDEYYYLIGDLRYEIYADKLDKQSQEPTQIEWTWQSAVQMFGTVELRKQLLFTTFVFDDYMPDDAAEQTIDFGYYFDIYSRSYTTSKPDATTATVYRVSNRACRTLIGSFNYLQLVLHNRDFVTVESKQRNFEALTKPKICSISMKYRTLRGEL